MLVGIEITSRCNLCCAMCGQPAMKRAKADMPWDLFTKIIDEIINEKHVLKQMHFYGEPLIAKHFVKAIEYLAGKNVRVTTSLSTNCMALVPAMTDSLIDAGFIEVHKNTDYVRLCIDSLEENVYKELRIGGNLERVIENAKYFISRVYGKIKKLTIQRLITRLNPDETDEKYIKEFGMDIPIRRQVCGRHHLKERDFTIIPFSNFGDRRSSCQFFKDNSIWISQCGEVTKCCLDVDFEQSIGNIKDFSIRQLIASEKFQNQKKEFSDFNYANLPVCSRCTGNECAGFE